MTANRVLCNSCPARSPFGSPSGSDQFQTAPTGSLGSPSGSAQSHTATTGCTRFPPTGSVGSPKGSGHFRTVPTGSARIPKWLLPLVPPELVQTADPITYCTKDPLGSPNGSDQFRTVPTGSASGSAQFRTVPTGSARIGQWILPPVPPESAEVPQRICLLCAHGSHRIRTDYPIDPI